MKKDKKSKEQLIKELQQRIAELETADTERMRAEDILHKSEERFRTLTENTSDWIWEVDQSLVFTYTSPKIKDLLGYEPHEIIGKTPFDLMPEHEAKRISEISRSILASRKPFTSLENINLHKDGHQVIIETSGVPIFDKNGDFSGYRGIDRDITGRKRTEVALQEIESRLHTLSDNLPDGIVYQIDSGEDGQQRRFSYLSAGVERLHGITVKEALNNTMSIYDQIIQEDRVRLAQEEAYAFSNMIPFSSEVRLKLPSGETRWRFFTSAPRRLHNNHIVWDGIEIDITTRKQAEESLRESEEKYRLLFENSSDAIFVAQDEMIKFSNRQLSLLTGYSTEELSSKSFRHFIHPEDRVMVVEMHRERLQGQNVPSAYSFRVVRKSGEIRWVEVNTVTIAWEERPATLAFLRDITERKMNDEILQEKERELEMKASNLEEVNTALNVLLKKRDEDRIELEEKISLNIRELVLPYLKKIQKIGLDERQNAYAVIMESYLNDIVSSFSHRLSSAYLNFTPSEINVANLVKQGRSNKEIAELLNISVRTAAFHRERIRKKLGIKNHKTNLKSYLSSIN
jgi:PAS domain S-box-containing protein